MITLRPATLADAATIVALNAAVVDATGPMDVQQFAALLSRSDQCTVGTRDGQVIGFVIAMHSDTAYENANFEWFAAQLAPFVYIDRIVIGGAGQGTGLGSRLYEHVAQGAKQHGLGIMAAEINLVPRNEGSLHFHSKHGFAQIGTRDVGTAKVVSMQTKQL